MTDSPGSQNVSEPPSSGSQNLPDAPSSGSHPEIRFEQLPIVDGPLSRLVFMRPKILGDVVDQTVSDLEAQSTEYLLAEGLYQERLRLKRSKSGIFTRNRLKGDRRLWGGVHSALLKSPAEVDRAEILRKVLAHYAEEIGGHFDPSVYKLATRAVPWGFSWLLNAASVSNFLPWGMTESLADRLRIIGEISWLRKLSEKGTILLVPTHQSNLDSVLIGYIIYLMNLPPFAYGAGLNLFSNPALNFFMGNLGAYTVDRQKTNLIYKQVLKNYSTRILCHGMHSVFFPGGGRSRSGAIESRVKLGLLGTGLEAQAHLLRANHPNPRVYVVPMVLSYHFVLEAASLIEDHLAEVGKHRFLQTSDESFQPLKIFQFFWKFFGSKSNITVRVGRPLDVFGNDVDEEGRSLGPNGTTIDPSAWLTSYGQLRPDLQRDRQYTTELGNRIVERFFSGNTVLTSHLVAFTFFELLRDKYPDLDLFRFLRLSLEQRRVTLEEFYLSAEQMHRKVVEAADRGELFLSDELRTLKVQEWVEDGARNLGLFHDAEVVRIGGRTVSTEDLSLLYYYRNRLAGYGFSRLSHHRGAMRKRGENDSQGFLA
jgi:glycerol-3-phosphate O-acyltransferase